jgi:mRNA-degrading endonuclease RelE of RelBE toxin-antitoxin system
MFHKELSKIGKDLHKLSKKIQKLSKKVAQKEAKVQKKIKTLPKVKQKLTGAGVEKPGIQRVLDIIQASDQGLDPKAIKHLTGLPKEKVHKILHKLFKDGEIMIESGGLYTGVKRGSRNS